jgi:carbamoyl-phosphate synthase small subunit
LRLWFLSAILLGSVEQGLQTTNGNSVRKKSPAEGSFFISEPSWLALEDGTTFVGAIPSWQRQSCVGEVVFNTGMTGYVESLTDPSYAGQILVFTYPLIGNYGVNPAWGESNKIQARGVVVSEAATNWSHTHAEYSLLEWLKLQHVPILTGVDTRALTKYLRTKGTMTGAIGLKPQPPKRLTEPLFVSVSEPTIHNEGGRKTIILVDCGAKENILRSLVALGLRVKRVPFDYDYIDEPYDGVLISNGPGDPVNYEHTVALTKKAFERDKPIFGICLGSQILALAAGAGTYKLKFGHRGHNQPCMATKDEHCFVTSQNHGYAIDEQLLPKDWSVTFRNLNDNSVEGIAHKSKPFFAVQFHPEACPGPTDTAWLFEEFLRTL